MKATKKDFVRYAIPLRTSVRAMEVIFNYREHGMKMDGKKSGCISPAFLPSKFQSNRSDYGSNSLTIARSSFNSFSVASIFARLNSVSGTSCTISHFPSPAVRIGNEVISPFSHP